MGRAALAAVICGLVLVPGAHAARADRCTGAPGAERGPVPAALTSAVPALRAARPAVMRYPGFRSPLLADVDPVYVDGARLWGAFDGFAYWVVPGRSCRDDADVACALATTGAHVALAACGAPDAIARGLAATAIVGGERLAVGLAPPRTGRVQFLFDDGGAILYAARGVFAGSLDVPSRHDGPVRSVRFERGPQQRYAADLVVVDQSGRPGRSAAVARRAAPEIRAAGDPRVVDLGAILAGTRARTAVVCSAGAKGLARRVARRLHAGAPRPMAGGVRALLAPITGVAVLAGRR